MRFANRLLVIVLALVLVLVIDVVSGGRWRWISGGGAVLVIIMALTPKLSSLIEPVGAYISLWLAFNFFRAAADDTGWAQRVLDLVPRLQARLFGDRLLAAVLQDRLYNPAAPGAFDYFWTTVYLSFFVVPHLAALILLWRARPLFWRFLLATAILFVLASVSFFAIPTAPPWLITELAPEARFGTIHRVAEDALRRLDLPIRLFDDGNGAGVRGSEVRVEPNPIAAMPSIHFAVTALLLFPARPAGRLLPVAAGVYACLMGVALVYLGEHYVLDLIAGGIMAAGAWAVSERLRDHRSFSRLSRAPSRPAPESSSRH